MTAGEKVARKWRGSPSSEYRFFLYDPEGNGFMFFASAEDRAKLAPSIIGEYCDEGWSEEVSCVCAGEVTASIVKTDVRVRPVRGDFETDEEFEDAEQDWPCSDFDEICDYKLQPIADSQRDALEAREKVPREALDDPCVWIAIEDGSGIYNTCKEGREFHLDEGLELYPHCMWCGKKILVGAHVEDYPADAVLSPGEPQS